MDYRSLLDRYFSGKTTLEEEQALKELFRKGVAPEELREFAPWFRLLDEEAGIEPVRSIELPAQRRSGWSTWRNNLMKAAAVILVAMGVWRLAPSPAPDKAVAIDWSKYEVTDEQEALRITRAAFKKVAQTLQFGASTAAEQVEKLGEISRSAAVRPSDRLE